MNLEDLRALLYAVNDLVSGLGCSDPEHQKKIEELQAAMQHVKDLADGMVE